MSGPVVTFPVAGSKITPKTTLFVETPLKVNIYMRNFLRGFMILVIVYCCLILHMFMVQLVLDQRPKIVCNIESWRKLRSMKFCVARLPHQRQWGEVAPNGNLCWKKGEVTNWNWDFWWFLRPFLRGSLKKLNENMVANTKWACFPFQHGKSLVAHVEKAIQSLGTVCWDESP